MLTCESAAQKNHIPLDTHFVLERALFWKCIPACNGGVTSFRFSVQEAGKGSTFSPFYHHAQQFTR